MDKKFNPRNKDILKFIIEDKFLIECDFNAGKYTWTNISEHKKKMELKPIEISRDLAQAYYEAKLEDYKQENEIRAHIDVFADLDKKIYQGEIPNQISAEEEFLKHETEKLITDAEDTLTDVQRERIEKHIIYKVPVTQLVIIENTHRNRIFKSIRQGLEKIKKYLEIFEK